MSNIKHISNYSLSELLSMITEIEHILNTYPHVEEHVPAYIKNGIRKFREKLTEEDERRIY